MFKNPGKGLKTLGKIIFVVIIIAFVIGAIVLIGNAKESSISATILGILLVGVGIIIAWVSSIAIYAFGELVENVLYIREDVENIKMHINNEM